MQSKKGCHRFIPGPGRDVALVYCIRLASRANAVPSPTGSRCQGGSETFSNLFADEPGPVSEVEVARSEMHCLA